MKPKQKTRSGNDRGGAEPNPEVMADGPAERIAKRMARAGLCSRREAETWIAAGRVSINGSIIATPAITVGPGDRIEVDGKPLGARERTRLWLYHKPAGLVTTARDPQGRRTVFSALPDNLPRVISVGRLDINTEGLLLLTNDGGLARLLELPKTGWLRRYRVRAHGKVTQEELDRLKDGIAVDGVLYGSIEAMIDRVQGSNVWLNLAFREGKNREVKEVLGALGLSVNRLIRISYGPFQLGDLAEGEVREIRGRTLRDQLGERLIAEAGADFDAPIHQKPALQKTEPGQPKAPGADAGKKSRTEARPLRRDRARKREEAIDRLDTKRPERPGRSAKKPGAGGGGKPRGARDADRRR